MVLSQAFVIVRVVYYDTGRHRFVVPSQSLSILHVV